MNESLDLRNRILKMRESNNLVMEQVEQERKILDAKSEINSHKKQKDLNGNEVSLETRFEKESSRVENKTITDSDLLKKKPANSNKEILNSLVNNNEAQFRMIAKKFNEAVEVILELSDKVKKLEETVHSLNVNSVKSKKSYSFFNFKYFVLIILTTLILLGLFNFPIDLTLIKLIITDVVSSI